tara:strand:+ start:102 stop:779 length:678 start_codon:yes stop_codon:yes gene_type:complete
MKVTNNQLRQIIQEELSHVMFEQSLNEVAVPEFDVTDLVPKAKKMKATRGEEDRMNEGGLLLGAAVALAAPKIMNWMGKAAKAALKNPTIAGVLKKIFGEQGQDKAYYAAEMVDKAGTNLHSFYLGTIKTVLVKPISLLSRVMGQGAISEEKQKKIAEALFIVLLGFFMVIGVAQIGGAAAAGTLGAKAGTLTIEGITTAVKAFETTEYAGMVPAALEFLKSAHH